MAKPLELTLPDIDGQPHEYIITPHPGMEAVELVWQIIDLCATPLAKMLNSNVGILLERMQDEKEYTFAELFEDADLNLDEAVNSVLKIIFTRGPAQLTADLFRYVSRDGKYMNERAKFNTAYQANVGEVFQVYRHVLEVNRFLELFRTFGTSIVDVRMMEEKMPQPGEGPTQNNVSSEESVEASTGGS